MTPVIKGAKIPLRVPTVFTNPIIIPVNWPPISYMFTKNPPLPGKPLKKGSFKSFLYSRNRFYLALLQRIANGKQSDSYVRRRALNER